ncbi:helix-turn-helix domain-containing protein [Paralysiella testudinis]|uniref:Helix-turn-helix domain-containing protein n=1 Tax=Paralysiella testudinis TaxID=2809020 RepID=A0A892ZM71_9NEIS|nr:helix-turn-helix domain-containing protein [Paralysiella testudinis]QRQ82877.1 helix-turn-helix domain-containing protein [Paralysiella testudinis]
MEIGLNIRARRKQLKMTLEQLANEIGSDSGNLSRIERGQQDITTEKLQVIARALNCTASELVTTEVTPPPSLPLGYTRVPVLNEKQILEWDKIFCHINHFEFKDWLITDIGIPAHSFSWTINDLSMSPDFEIGDRIIIHPKIRPSAGDYVIGINPQGCVIFRKFRDRGVGDDGVQIFELFPQNLDFVAYLSSRDKIELLGVMVEHRKYRHR